MADVGTVDPSNEEQARAWDGAQGARWAEDAARFDRSVSGYRAAFRAAAAVPAGAAVLDVGCGSGQTTRDAVRDGAASALGVDLSSQMIELARDLSRREGVSGTRFLQADAQVHPFAEASVDLVISRTGTMFFGDPPAAFANLARATRPGGRLVQLVWRELRENEWLPALAAALTGSGGMPAPPPGSPGPFSLGDPDRVRELLTGAGFADCRVEPVSAPLVFGRDPDDAEVFVLGLFGWLIDGLDDAGRAAARDRLRADLEAHWDGQQVAYGSAGWLVSARRR
jgi:SAM-dependent methyltransferase